MRDQRWLPLRSLPPRASPTVPRPDKAIYRAGSPSPPYRRGAAPTGELGGRDAPTILAISAFAISSATSSTILARFARPGGTPRKRMSGNRWIAAAWPAASLLVMAETWALVSGLYAELMVPDLDRTLATASWCGVFDAGMWGGGRALADQLALTLQGPEDLAQLRSLLRVRGGGGFACGCLGSVTFRFRDDAGRVLASVALHHAVSLRWDGWEGGHRELADGTALVEWLAARGYTGPLDELRASQALREWSAAERQAWSKAVPEPARPLLPGMLAAGQSGTIPPDLLQELRQILAGAWPDDVERCRALLAWFSTGTGRYSGYPAYEAIPGMLLAGMPIAVVVRALWQDQADERAWRGAVRHLTAWQARPAQELQSIPLQMRPQLLAIAQSAEEIQARRLKESWSAPR